MKQKINYSELVYLYADKYIQQGSFLQNKEELPNGNKVNIVKLGNKLVEAAFAYLYLNGYIDLQIETKKILGLFPKKVVTSKSKLSGEELSSIESSLLGLSDGTDIFTIIYKFIGAECAVPWAVPVDFVKESLVQKQILIKEKITKKVIVSFVTYKYHINNSVDQDYKDEVAEMDNKSKEFASKDFYKLLVKSIESGINSRKEIPDSDSD